MALWLPSPFSARRCPALFIVSDRDPIIFTQSDSPVALASPYKPDRLLALHPIGDSCICSSIQNRSCFMFGTAGAASPKGWPQNDEPLPPPFFSPFSLAVEVSKIQSPLNQVEYFRMEAHPPRYSSLSMGATLVIAHPSRRPVRHCDTPWKPSPPPLCPTITQLPFSWDLASMTLQAVA